MRERDKYLSRESEKKQYERKVVNDTKSSVLMERWVNGRRKFARA